MGPLSPGLCLLVCGLARGFHLQDQPFQTFPCVFIQCPGSTPRGRCPGGSARGSQHHAASRGQLKVSESYSGPCPCLHEGSVLDGRVNAIDITPLSAQPPRPGLRVSLSLQDTPGW